jgi:acetoin utilization deacetylase AcuC-like enzyme
VRSPFGVRVPDRVDPLVAEFIEANAVPTAYITHPSFLLHEMGPYHPECPDRLTAIGDRLISAGLDAYLRHYSAPAATVEQLGRVHSRDYIAMIEAESPMTGLHFLDPDTAMNPHSLAAARHAAGAVVLATELLLSGECRNAFCAVRPPGHHAERERAMGFCLFNNVAVGAAHALAQGLERVAVVDFDVHHGNGTEVMFSDDPRVLMVSTFQHPFVPVLRARQSRAEHGQHPAVRGHGRHRVSQSGDRALDAGDRAAPPEMLFVSAGFDAHREDPLAG